MEIKCNLLFCQFFYILSSVLWEILEYFTFHSVTLSLILLPPLGSSLSAFVNSTHPHTMRNVEFLLLHHHPLEPKVGPSGTRWASLPRSIAWPHISKDSSRIPPGWPAGPGFVVGPVRPVATWLGQKTAALQHFGGSARGWGKQRRLRLERLIPCLDYEHHHMQKQEAKTRELRLAL